MSESCALDTAGPEICNSFVASDGETMKALDIGSTRRQLEIAGVTIPSTKLWFKSHRAVEDAAVHAQEMRDFFKWARYK